MRRLALLVWTSLLLAACGGDEGTARPDTSSLIGRNLQVLPGDAGALRIAFEPLGATARVIVQFTPVDAVVDVCPLPAPDAAVPEREACVRDVRAGVREPVRGARSGVVIALRSDRPADADVVIEYQEGARTMTIGLPVVAPPPGGADCSDNACNPFFELVPTRPGPFEARASWRGPDGLLVLLQGSVLGRSQTATGIPYAQPARREGAAPLRLSATLSAPAEYALALRHTRSGSAIPPMRDVVLEVSWPG